MFIIKLSHNLLKIFSRVFQVAYLPHHYLVAVFIYSLLVIKLEPFMLAKEIHEFFELIWHIFRLGAI
jgi:hypothetical protein